MKKIYLAFAALAALCTLSCTKDEVPAGKNTIHVSADVNYTEPVTRVSLSGTTLSWEVGDKLRCRWNSGDTYSDTDACQTLTAQTAAAASTFEGVFTYYNESGNLYYYYSEDGEFVSSTSVAYKHSISATQTGQLADLKNHLLFYGVKYNSGLTFNKTGGVVTGISFKAEPGAFFSIVKLNVPESLGVTSIALTGTSNIAGTARVQPQKNNSISTTSTGVRFYRSGDDTQGTTVTVSNGGATLSGDVYFVLMPDAYDSDADEYYCSTESLSFTFTTGSGDITITRDLNSCIYNASLKDLGSVPSTLKPTLADPGTLCVVSGKELSIGVADYNTECTYYYETSTTSFADCATPTTSSTSFDPSTGFTISTTNGSDEYYIKVRAESTSGNAILRGYVKSWTFGAGTPARDSLLLVQSGAANAFTAIGDNCTTSDGLYLYEIGNTSSAFAATTIGYGTGFVKPSNCFITINATAQYSSHAWFYIKTDNSKSNMGNTRQIKLIYNLLKAAGTTDFYNGSTSGKSGNTTITIAGVDASSATSQFIVWDLGSITAGNTFAPRNDGNYALYTLALFEAL